MGSNTIGARGVTLPPPQALYPPLINNLPALVATNRVSLAGGQDVHIPSGTFMVSPGNLSQMQILDPVTNTWTPWTADTTTSSNISVNSDGYNYRVYNPTGFPIGALVNNGGTGYTSAPAVATGSAQGATWQSIVGGALSAINITSGGSGANYGIPPIVNIANPPSPGVPATAVANISGGIVTGFTIINPGAGYASAPAVVLATAPNDPNAASTSTVNITTATATAQLSYVGVVTAILMTNQGTQPLTAAPTLTLSGGGGSGALATAVMALTATGYTVTTGGSGYGTGPASVQTIGGLVTSAAAASNSPVISTGLFVPRQAIIQAATSSGGISLNGNTGGGVIYGGLFQAPPLAYVVPGAAGTAGAAAAVAVTVGAANDTITIQPL